MSIFEQLKKELNETVEKMQPDNVAETKKQVDKYFSLASFMIQVMLDEEQQKEEAPAKEETKKSFVIKNPVTEAAVEQEEPKQETAPIGRKEEIDELAKVFDKKKILPIYPFSRKLTGGYLSTPVAAQNIFVPENIVRSNNFEEGDMIEAEALISGSHIITDYNFKIHEKSKLPNNTGRLEFLQGIVEYDASLRVYFVQKNLSGEALKIDDVPMRFIISDQDAKKHLLSIGDIVDVSWYHNNFEKGRVFWKHRMDEFKTQTIDKKVLSAPKKTLVKPKEDTTEEQIEQTLTGKTIVMVGAEGSHMNFREVVESRGGYFIGITDGTHKLSMTSAIKKADAVLVCISQTTHRDSQHANEKAKLYKVPFASFSGEGKGVFLATIYKALKMTIR